MRRSVVEDNEEPEANSKTLWAYAPCRLNTPNQSDSESSSLLSIFCCCFSNEENRQSQTDRFSVNFAVGDSSVTLSRALLCLDNPQIPNDQVSYPISEDVILADHRSQNVLQHPYVIRSTQMLFMGYDLTSLQSVNLQQSLSPNEARGETE